MTEMNNNIANAYAFESILNSESSKTFCKEYFIESMFNFVLTETAKKTKVYGEQINHLHDILDEFTSSYKIKFSIGHDDDDNKQTHEFVFSNFMSEYDISGWMYTVMALFKLVIDNRCYYEDKLFNGFCWRSPIGEFCSLTYELADENNDNKDKDDSWD